MDDFIQSQGVIWLPHILRRLANRFTDACDLLFERYDIMVPARLVSVVHLLHDRGPCGVTAIAAITGQSHPLINNYLKRLGALGLVTTAPDTIDRRRTLVALTDAGHAQAERLLAIRPVLVDTYRDLLASADADIFDALWRIEAALKRQGFAERVTAKEEAERAS
ncbi:MarR family winged helix-turn-helix transcriptional regulator [Sphingomonas sp.]|uniref:MarR family winged helix-turn-helix transcriptional regulator n=1 Tax=Sphingomonas sp. TaxID=28214 RepID=UPI0025F06F8E|nr:ArsR family transcriptional regulator [Sphingomonas sp.]